MEPDVLLQRIKDKMKKLDVALSQQKKFSKGVVDGVGNTFLFAALPAVIAVGVAGVLAAPLAVLSGMAVAAIGASAVYAGAKLPLVPPKKRSGREPPSPVSEDIFPVMVMGCAVALGVALALWPVAALAGIGAYAGAASGAAFYRRPGTPRRRRG